MVGLLIRRIKLFSLISTAYVFTGLVPNMPGQTCKPPDATKLTSTTIYIAKHYHIQNTSRLSLLGYEKVGDSCFWALHFQMTDTKRDIPLYLSPDQKYITTTLYDLQDDPLAEEQARADATMKTLVADDPPERGARNAKVTIVEFSDFECPYCKKMKVMLDQEMKVDSQPSISIVFRSNPLSIHPWAKVAAQIAECVQLQNPSDFWKVHDFFFDNQQSITALNIGELSTQFITANTSIDIKLYHSCVTRDLAVGPVTQDLNMGQKFGVQGTPTLFINGVKAPPISDGSQLHSIIETIEHGGSALDMTLPVLNNSVPILANSGGQCAPTIRTGAANVEIK